MGEKSGSFGQVTYDGNTLNIEIDQNSLGSIALSDGRARVECYWDGSEWVCRVIGYGSGGQTESQAAD